MESFEQITNQYQPMIYKIISSLHIYMNKDEFYQIALIALWEAYERFDPEKGNFTGYAYSYIKGRLLTEMNHANKHFDHTCPANEEILHYVEDESCICPLEEDTLLAYCQAAALTENQTKWVLYTYLKGFNVKEIASIEKVSLSAVKSWRTGATDRLKKSIIGNQLI
ncbi:DNA-directed RNA polymerase [Cytobacillus eiseniae]|uniref:DNA-directed RNA polymerase n=1 Tax=Cytobacillus eiseniae TaxID=762947 RepID=A0ABS4RH63_9BACI|nr:sigma-70 family RNA polymerase sigma factor [Cytobacillus eiseniae]MBP2242223.1 DNA-directed RNA polymerase [Cytobacillus eiseniae]